MHALLSAADGFVITMLATMALSLGVIGALIFCMRRNVAKRDREVDKLLEEIAAEEEREEREEREKHKVPPAEPPQAKPWERDGDWWKE